MKKTLFLFAILFGVFFLLPKEANTASVTGPCSFLVHDKNGKPPPFYVSNVPSVNSILTYKIGNLIEGRQYKIDYKCIPGCLSTFTKTAVSQSISGTASFNAENVKHDIYFDVYDTGSVSTNPYCRYKINPSDWEPKPTPSARAECQLFLTQPGNPHIKDETWTIDKKQDIIVNGNLINVVGMNNYRIYCGSATSGSAYCNASLIGPPPAPKNYNASNISVNNSTFSLNLGHDWPDGNYVFNSTVNIQYNTILSKKVSCSITYNIPGGVINNSAFPVTNAPPPLTPFPSLAPLCKQIPGEFYVKCKQCIDTGKIWTAVGCIAPDFGSFISQQILGWGVGIAGAIAFLYFLWGAFLFLTSAGNPEKVAMAREIIMSSLMGLLLIIFSVYLLKIISVDILQIPEFRVP